MPQRRRQLPLTASLLAASLLATLACQEAPPAEEAPAPAGERAENPEVGVALAAVPAAFRVDVNEGGRFELVPSAEGGTGRVAIVAGEAERGGINLVAAIETHKAEILEREGGEYKGQRELGTHLGTAFYSRGQYQGDAGPTEETVVFLVHPTGDRKLMLRYQYPLAEDSQQRLEQLLFEVLDTLEPATPEPAPAVEGS